MKPEEKRDREGRDEDTTNALCSPPPPLPPTTAVAAAAFDGRRRKDKRRAVIPNIWPACWQIFSLSLFLSEVRASVTRKKKEEKREFEFHL